MSEWKLVHSIDPLRDRAVSQAGYDIALYHDEIEIRILTWYEADKCWYIVGHQSVETATGTCKAEKEFSYHKIDYIEDAYLTYGMLSPEDDISRWHDLYDDVKGGGFQAYIEENDDILSILAISVPVGLFSADNDGRMTYLSDQWLKITGLDKSKLLGFGWTNFISDLDTSRLYKELDNFTGPTFQTEIRANIGDGERWLLIHISRIDSDGKKGYVGTIVDITDSKQYQTTLEKRVHARTAEIKKSEEALRELALGTSTFLADDFYQEVVKRTAATIDCLDCVLISLLEGRHFRTIAQWTDNKKDVAGQRVPVGGTPCEQVLKQRQALCFPDHLGKLFPEFLQQQGMVSYIGSPIIAGNEVLGVIAGLGRKPLCLKCSCKNCRHVSLLMILANRVATEICRERMLNTIKRERARYAAIIECQTDLIYRCLPDTTLTFVNSAYCNFFQFNKKDLLGNSFLDFVSPEHHSTVNTHFQNVLKTKQKNSHIHNVISPGGITVQEWTFVPVLSPLEKVHEVQSVGRVYAEPQALARTSQSF